MDFYNVGGIFFYTTKLRFGYLFIPGSGFGSGSDQKFPDPSGTGTAFNCSIRHLLGVSWSHGKEFFVKINFLKP
jgi:hypothetical protein